jgi:hypothetical protein
MVGMYGWFVTKAFAVGSTDTITLLVLPTPALAVTISSPAVGIGYDFTSVDVNAVSQSGIAATVENTGNSFAQWMLRAQQLDTWSVGMSTVGTDVAVLQALFGQVGGEYPTLDMFDSVDSTMTTDTRTSDNDARFSTGSIMPDAGISPASGVDKRMLWFKIKTPEISNVGSEQKFRVYVVAGNP